MARKGSAGLERMEQAIRSARAAAASQPRPMTAVRVNNNFTAGRDASGQPIVMLQQQTLSAMNPIDMMRALRKAYPEEWRQINMEVVSTQNGLIVPETTEVSSESTESSPSSEASTSLLEA